MRTKLVFVLLTNYYQLFHALFYEIDISRSTVDIPVYQDHINPG